MLCSMTWQLATVPIDLQTMVAVPLFIHLLRGWGGLCWLLLYHPAGVQSRGFSPASLQNFFRACLVEWRPQGRPKDYVTWLSWEDLGILPHMLEEFSGERKVWVSLLRLQSLILRPGLAEEYRRMDEWKVIELSSSYTKMFGCCWGRFSPNQGDFSPVGVCWIKLINSFSLCYYCIPCCT